MKVPFSEVSPESRRRAITTVAIVCLAANLLILDVAYPHTIVPAATKARDFSSYYIAAWRLIHDPAQVYHVGALPGDYPIPPAPAAFKNLPSLIPLILPFLALSYTDAIVAFDTLQFLLLPVMALLIYRMLRGRSLLAVAVPMVTCLLEPIPPDLVPTKLTSFAVSYYDLWVDGNAKVLVTFFIVVSLFLAREKRPAYSGIVFALAWFDPRFPLLALPLFLYYNRGGLKGALPAFFASLLASNALALYSGIGQQAVASVLSEGLSTPLFGYAWIPIWTVVSLSLVELLGAAGGRRRR